MNEFFSMPLDVMAFVVHVLGQLAMVVGGVLFIGVVVRLCLFFYRPQESLFNVGKSLVGAVVLMSMSTVVNHMLETFDGLTPTRAVLTEETQAPASPLGSVPLQVSQSTLKDVDAVEDGVRDTNSWQTSRAIK